jgi:hypothetical protein
MLYPSTAVPTGSDEQDMNPSMAHGSLLQEHTFLCCQSHEERSDGGYVAEKTFLLQAITKVNLISIRAQ